MTDRIAELHKSLPDRVTMLEESGEAPAEPSGLLARSRWM